jgi:hypothetical protein
MQDINCQAHHDPKLPILPKLRGGIGRLRPGAAVVGATRPVHRRRYSVRLVQHKPRNTVKPTKPGLSSYELASLQTLPGIFRAAFFLIYANQFSYRDVSEQQWSDRVRSPP